jgi:2-oxoisovalerate ferredoxin oxidoreductase beta subunit
LQVSELLSSLQAPVYIERVALSDGKHIMQARKAIRKALTLQKENAGFTLVEILSPCPTIWKKDPVEARKWVAEQMIPNFPLGVKVDRTPEIPQIVAPQHTVAEVLELTADSGHSKHQGKPCSIKVAGFGGQGVLLLGIVLAEMGMRENLEVSWLPSYGPEMRSGSAHCHVCLSKDRIGSPLISHPEVLVAMNEISLRKFAPSVAPGGLILYNRDSLPENFSCERARVECVPASEIADHLGSAKVANIVMLGALLEETECMSPKTVMDVIENEVKKPHLLEVNRRALEAGRKFVEKAAQASPVSQPDGFAY